MAGLDKEEMLALVDTVKSVALRLGSTRWLNLVTVLMFLGYLASLDTALVLWLALLGFGLGVWTAISFHRKPHIDRSPEAK